MANYTFKERFKLTRPKTKSGDVADFYAWLKLMNGGKSYNGNYVRFKSGSYMTFQALRDKKLAEYTDKHWRITEAGRFYVKYVDSTNAPQKDVLRAIMGVA